MIGPVAAALRAGSAPESQLAMSVAPKGNDFESALQGLVHETQQSLQAGEAAAVAGLKGTMPLQNVVSAVMSAEQSLNVAIAIRDKAVSAYTEISRMAI